MDMIIPGLTSKLYRLDPLNHRSRTRTSSPLLILSRPRLTSASLLASDPRTASRGQRRAYLGHAWLTTIRQGCIHRTYPFQANGCESDRLLANFRHRLPNYRFFDI